MNWIKKEVAISDIDTLIQDGFEVEVDSPDGWVGVNYFINKGLYNEYLLTTECGKKISCNESHLFETSTGWMSAKNMVNIDTIVLTESGFVSCSVLSTGNVIPIVDINVNHPNHRYYTEGVSSHNTGVGKSLFLCHHAANCLKQHQNVLYITCEMAEERIAERIDANLLDVTLDNLRELTKVVYEKKMQNLSAGVRGKLIIKEYPTATANVNHFRFLLDELHLKRKFKPDVIIIDYLNICASARLKSGNNINSYTYIKSIAEELRGLAVEYNVPIFSATQTTRSGFSNSDVGLEDTSESFGLPATADFMFALISTDELAEMNQIMVKQLKNRYNDTTINRKFILGINKAKMKIFDIKKEDNVAIVPKQSNNSVKDQFAKGTKPNTDAWKF
jgi:hypothetical protein